MKQYQRGRLFRFRLVTATLLLGCLVALSGCVSQRKGTNTSAAKMTAETQAVLSDETGETDASEEMDGTDASASSTASESTKEPAKTTKKTTKKTAKTEKSEYKIIVYIGSQSTVVYKLDEKGGLGSVVKTFTCSTGSSASPTRAGDYEVRGKQRWLQLVGGVYGQYGTRISGHYLFHSVPYLQQDPSTLKNEEYDKLGRRASKGCIRMCIRDCKWIYDHIPVGTAVTITSGSGPAGAGVPGRNADPIYNGWDPSDKWSQGNPYFTEVTETQTSATTATATAAETESSTETTTAETTATTATAADSTDNNQTSPANGD